MRRFVRGMRLTVINPSNFVGSLQFTSDLPPMTLTISSQGNSYFIYFSYKNLARMENSLYLCPKYLNINIRHILNI